MEDFASFLIILYAMPLGVSRDIHGVFCRVLGEHSGSCIQSTESILLCTMLLRGENEIFHSDIEFWLALLVNIMITGIYSLVVYFMRTVLPADELLDRGMRIPGLVLMVMTDTL